jgi:AcrR family transcriptional regulator
VSLRRESAPTTASSGALKIDGRRLRSERTRLAIIEAYLELLRQYSVMPTAAQLADEAGCSVRSIFERFSDLDALKLAVADYAIVQGQPQRPLRQLHMPGGTSLGRSSRVKI